ncbi:hypothetical protein PPYR_09571 [Photinus pyralis]|uniref:PDZ domain-containing protein n=1 Tax=Photinus pyralis TaxID=7054 RepID=A0A5N4AMY8_PHOPY|nr:whirlin isoform X7 [Photinus pyralis]KAB0798578.1 hypothetical protein PPYR_09571 [Photinus pyralis]
MRTSDEFSAELTEYSSYGGTRYGGNWNSRTPSNGRNRIPAEAEDALGSTDSPRGYFKGRSGLYYSPPGTSYTIVERPSSGMHHHSSRDREFSSQHYVKSPKGTYLGSNPNFERSLANNKKRPISPEQVLRLFGTTQNQSSNKLNVERPRRSPASSPASTTHQVNYRIPSYGFSIHELVTRTVTMVRDPPDGTHGFGICVKGGKEAGVGVYISRVEEGSVAERAGLRPGDSILEVNGTPFTAITHEEALKMLKSCRKLSMTVKSPAMPAGALESRCGPLYPRQTCSWMDRQGRPVSPPLEYSRMSGVPPQRYGYNRSSSKDRSIRRVDLCIEPGQSLGLMIRGGVEYNLGIFVTGVDKESVADRAGLMVGDQILEVNGQSFLDVTHDEAVTQLKYHKRMSLLVRDVGKVPHSCTPYDRDWDLCSPGSKAAHTTKKWSAALQMVEEKAKCLLSKPEFTSLCYYVDEYASRHMTIDAFVHVMTEVLSTPEKHTLMTELREVVAVEDRSRFDELVYRKDTEVLRGRDPRDYDYRHSRRKAGMAESNNAPFLSTFPESDYTSGDDENPTENRSRRHSSPGESQTGSATALHQPDYSDSELAHKLSRSFDMKDGQNLIESEGGMRRHQSMQRLSRDGISGGGDDSPNVVTDEGGNLRITVKKTKPILGIAIEGGANTKHPLPRIININENGAAYSAGGLEVGQLILQVDGTRVEGLQHQDVARLIAESFARRDREEIEFLVVEAKKSNMEPKPTALIFLEA